MLSRYNFNSLGYLDINFTSWCRENRCEV